MVPPKYHAKLEVPSPTYIEIPHPDPGGVKWHHFLYSHRKKNLTWNQLIRKAVAFTKYLRVNRLLKFLHCARYAKCKTFCSNFIICLLFSVKTFNSIPKMLGEGDGFFANCIRLKTASNLTIMMRISDTGIMQIFTKENYFLSKHF